MDLEEAKKIVLKKKKLCKTSLVNHNQQNFIKYNAWKYYYANV